MTTKDKALRQALEDEQEPVAWMLECQTMTGDTGWILSWSRSGAGLCIRLQGEEHEKPLYTAPHKRPPLTDDEICEALGIDGSDDWTYTVARAVEAKLNGGRS